MNDYAQRNHYSSTTTPRFGKGNTGKFRLAQETTSHAEDYQPNESINKRKQAVPPVISAANRGGKQYFRGAGSSFRGGSYRGGFLRRQSSAGGFPLRATSSSSFHATSPWNVFNTFPTRIYAPQTSYSSSTNANGQPSGTQNTTEAVEVRASNNTMEPQSKRQKLTHEDAAAVAASIPHSQPSDASLKSEEADIGLDAPLSATPTMSGSKWYHPLPPNCQKSNPNWSANRKHWFKQESKYLRSRGLNILRNFFRDDGMVIDWSSPVPVWSDTLEPDQSSSSFSYPPPITSKSKKRCKKSKASKHTLNSITSSEPIVLPGPALAPPSDNNIDITSVIPSDDEPEIIVIDDDDDYTEPATQPPITQTFADVDRQATMESHALQYLKQYVLTFDHDRSLLREAYTDHALFSYSIVRDKPLSISEAHLFSGCETSSNTTLKVGPADIVETLSSFGKHQFFPRHATLNVDYDLLYLGNDQILLSVHGQVVEPRSDGEDVKVAVDQSFVLCSEDSGPWPLVAISHQMVLRDQAWVPASQLRLSWL
ncbi:uncharacterized protein EV420DRAFT_1538885 [Desarmillaria tabescens]|uniref:NTF2 domain-containing protein n=1 Tax=Armillaria tabescens TaxID=1929756 RepID=A0AA39KDJ3_ARMTA|nr:uncharacterized protein EV420DRAFT_1538885 [Desarmillaria tabescens]KAK0459202.1 hypothetical protein EV420DRAFT_1538885 [Desarmillaria tabescens]